MIKVKTLKSDSIYPLAERELYVGDEISLVGFGYGSTQYEQSLLKNPSTKRKSNKHKENIRYYKKKKKQAGYTLTDWYYSKQLEIAKKGYKSIDFNDLLSRHTTKKRYGTNKVGFSDGQIYMVYGAKRSRDAKVAGKVVTVSPGDSGGPMLERTFSGYIVHGVASTFGTEGSKASSSHVNVLSKSSQDFIQGVFKK